MHRGAHRWLVGIVIAAGLCVAASSAAAIEHPWKSSSPSKLKLPAERTSPSGNFFTLEAYDAPTSHTRVANFEMKVCTSKHTPADTAIDPALFTLSLAKGGTVAESPAVARSPAMVFKPLKPPQCTEGWLGFKVPKGKAVSTLVYDYKGAISWDVG